MSPVISEIPDKFSEEDIEEDVVPFEEKEDEVEIEIEKEFVCIFATNPHKGPCVGEVLKREDLGMALCDRHYKYLKSKEGRKKNIK